MPFDTADVSASLPFGTVLHRCVALPPTVTVRYIAASAIRQNGLKG
jgi:hypothetical protein